MHLNKMLTKLRSVRKRRIRGKIKGTKNVPRLSVFRSNKKIYAQLIDDKKSVTLSSAFGDDPKSVGEEIAKKASGNKIQRAVFDRSGYQYHGKVKLLADSARKAGLKI